MDWRWISPVRYLLNLVRGERTRHQLALGFALGIAIGLLPKGNLTAMSMTALLLGTRVNTGVGLLTALCVSCLAHQLDPLLGTVGRTILLQERWQGTFSAWYELSLVPWFGLHNTVVLGALVFGSVAFLPAYFLSGPVFAICRLDRDDRSLGKEDRS